MSAVCCPSCGNAVFPSRYETEEARVEARRRSWRESARRSRIRRSFMSAPPVVAVCPEPELTDAHRYWLDRFSPEEIWELGSGLLMFEVSEQEVAA